MFDERKKEEKKKKKSLVFFFFSLSQFFEGFLLEINQEWRSFLKKIDLSDFDGV
jgi:hypothetical protein